MNMALNCASRTLGCEFVVPDTAEVFAAPLALDYGRRLERFLETTTREGDREEDAEADDPHFHRTLANMHLLEPGFEKPRRRSGYQSAIGGCQVSAF